MFTRGETINAASPEPAMDNVMREDEQSGVVQPGLCARQTCYHTRLISVQYLTRCTSTREDRYIYVDVL